MLWDNKYPIYYGSQITANGTLYLVQIGTGHLQLRNGSCATFAAKIKAM